MKIALIICGSIYLVTVLYNLIAAHAIASAVLRKIKIRHPKLAKKKVKTSISERITQKIPAFIPLFHIGMAVVFLFNYEYLVEASYDKAIVNLTLEGES